MDILEDYGIVRGMVEIDDALNDNNLFQELNEIQEKEKWFETLTKIGAKYNIYYDKDDDNYSHESTADKIYQMQCKILDYLWDTIIAMMN